MSATEKTVAQLKAYGKYIYDNAEGIVGNIDKPNYVTTGGMRIAFTVSDRDSGLTLDINRDYVYIENDVLLGDGEEGLLVYRDRQVAREGEEEA